MQYTTRIHYTGTLINCPGCQHSKFSQPYISFVAFVCPVRCRKIGAQAPVCASNMHDGIVIFFSAQPHEQPSQRGLEATHTCISKQRNVEYTDESDMARWECMGKGVCVVSQSITVVGINWPSKEMRGDAEPFLIPRSRRLYSIREPSFTTRL
jgi:hypothetical protein